jgi:hypothetical protein
VESALQDLEDRLSPIEVVSGAISPLARALHETVEEVVSQGTGSREALRSAIPRLREILASLRDENSTRAFLRGLTAWVAAQPRTEAPPGRSGLIVTPDELRAAREGDGATR